MRCLIFTLLAVCVDHRLGPCMRRLHPTAVLPDPTGPAGAPARRAYRPSPRTEGLSKRTIFRLKHDPQAALDAWGL
jgi:hypothetical protein